MVTLSDLEAAALRSRDRRFEEDFGAPQRFPGARLDAGIDAAQINLFADFDGFDSDAGARLLHNVERGGHDFGADAVAVGDGDGDKIRCHVYRAIRSNETVES